MAEYPFGGGVSLFGGHSDTKEDRILILDAGANSWIILNNVSLKNRRREHIVIPLNSFHE